MCGGHGSRFDSETEKPLYEIAGRPMVDRVREALAESRVETTYAVVSPNAPRTRRHVDTSTIDAPGEGYVADLQYALERVEAPVLTVAADLPLLDGEAVDTVLDVYRGDSVLDVSRDDSVTVYVPAARKRSLGVSIGSTTTHDGETVTPAGINVVDGPDDTVYLTEDVRFAVNVNYREDATLAESRL